MGFLSMAFFHLPLLLNKKITFYKLMGSGKNGTFSKMPDLKQWALLIVNEQSIVEKQPFGKFISTWFKLFASETLLVYLEPVKSHGSWDGKNPFAVTQNNLITSKPIAVLTRANIHFNKLSFFWKHVAPASASMRRAEGLLFSAGIGEMPWKKQATFSIWQDETSMKNFAYQTATHAEIVKKTRAEKWYKEDLFARFTVLSCEGTLAGKNPLTGIA